MNSSREKLEAAANKLKTFAATNQILFDIQPCQSEEDAMGYRCKCSFQLVGGAAFSEKQQTIRYEWAVRKNQQPVVMDEFPPANQRIRQVMKDLVCVFERKSSTSITRHLTSATIVTSWDEKECFVTLHYDQAIVQSAEWCARAQEIARELHLSQIVGQAKKRSLKAFKERNGGNDRIRDSLWILEEKGDSKWRVALDSSVAPDGSPDDCNKEVKYEKPLTAFFHPNARVMQTALEWMLNTVAGIKVQRNAGEIHLLELYCGCGAHTIPLAKSGLFHSILAIELDERLVEACRFNVNLNGLNELVTVRSANAKVWSRNYVKNYTPSSANEVLLVDPPRQGLDTDVCQLACTGGFEHILYVSCGHEALVRDLKLLLDSFTVQSCTLLDLFPGTTSVESLVYLRRKR